MSKAGLFGPLFFVPWAAAVLPSPVLGSAGSTLGRHMRSGAQGERHVNDCIRWVAAALVLLTSLVPLGASAADLSVSVVDGRGQGVADAVVSVVPASSAHVSAARPTPSVNTVDQKDLAFLPYLTIFRSGDAVLFRNSDRTRHHVYSFSPTRQFEFVLSPGQRSPPLILDKPGVVAVGCNIHDQMIAYLYVSDAPWIGRTAAAGRVLLRGLPPGTYAVHVWQPRMRPGRQDQSQPLRVNSPADAPSLRFSLALLPDMRSRRDAPMGY
jgi:plastocyanin